MLLFRIVSHALVECQKTTKKYHLFIDKAIWWFAIYIDKKYYYIIVWLNGAQKSVVGIFFDAKIPTVWVRGYATDNLPAAEWKNETLGKLYDSDPNLFTCGL